MIKQGNYSNQRRHQVSDMDFKKQKDVLWRIKRAYDYVEAHKGNQKLLDQAEKRFQESVIPEAVKVGIEEHFAWALFFFGKEFLNYELINR